MQAGDLTHMSVIVILVSLVTVLYKCSKMWMANQWQDMNWLAVLQTLVMYTSKNRQIGIARDIKTWITLAWII